MIPALVANRVADVTLRLVAKNILAKFESVVGIKPNGQNHTMCTFTTRLYTTIEKSKTHANLNHA